MNDVIGRQGRGRFTKAVGVVLASTAAVGVWTLREPSAQSECHRTCTAELRDANGCCPAEGAGASNGGGTAAPKSCEDGMAGIGGGFLGASIKPFCIDKREVTAHDFAACVSSGKCSAPSRTSAKCNFGNASRDSHPMNCVAWPSAEAYCDWKSKRLPTEQEWEWVARGGGRANAFPWGGGPMKDRVCWSGDGNTDGTCAVGSHPAGDTPTGVSDMSGNVWEWTSSKFEAIDGVRVVRGGGWIGRDPEILRTASRTGFAANAEYPSVGFRCAAEPSLSK